ncbi:hypothetical protein CEXT_72891 [Caerostris extrusa]|uniref:Uncharacterized protein n=1 Tax=Caerostris extrusa TaxID=172846 RepID=A0AAV4WAZ1_CAEEX|nr:hypothetical protein CEXT_72891 [Caerostris extrusa]
MIDHMGTLFDESYHENHGVAEHNHDHIKGSHAFTPIVEHGYHSCAAAEVPTIATLLKMITLSRDFHDDPHQSVNHYVH